MTIISYSVLERPTNNMLGIRTCVYHVAELEKAKEWYSKAFQTQPYFDEPFYVGFNIEGFELGLLQDDENSLNKGTSVVCYWGVEAIEMEYERLLELGATAYEAPNNVGGELKVATVKDPWGNLLGLIYNPYFKLP